MTIMTCEEKLQELTRAAAELALEADIYACGEGDLDDLEEAISRVEALTASYKVRK